MCIEFELENKKSNSALYSIIKQTYLIVLHVYSEIFCVYFSNGVVKLFAFTI